MEQPITDEILVLHHEYWLSMAGAIGVDPPIISDVDSVVQANYQSRNRLILGNVQAPVFDTTPQVLDTDTVQGASVLGGLPPERPERLIHINTYLSVLHSL